MSVGTGEVGARVKIERNLRLQDDASRAAE
jgi:hypothetical protein